MKGFPVRAVIIAGLTAVMTAGAPASPRSEGGS